LHAIAFFSARHFEEYPDVMPAECTLRTDLLIARD
jgi:hypothetical protein